MKLPSTSWFIASRRLSISLNGSQVRVGCNYPIRPGFLALQPCECQKPAVDGVITPYRPAGDQHRADAAPGLRRPLDPRAERPGQRIPPGRQRARAATDAADRAER